jgi:hypothetical protein
MKANRFHSLILGLGLILGAGIATAQDVAPAGPDDKPAQVQAQASEPANPLPPPVSGTRQTEIAVNDSHVESASAPTAPGYTVFGMDSTAGVMIGIVLMLVFILAIVAFSRNERSAAV